MRSRTARRWPLTATIITVFLLLLATAAEDMKFLSTPGPRVPVADAQDLEWTQKIDSGLRTLSEAARSGQAPSAAQARSVGVATDRGQLRVIAVTNGGSTSNTRSAARTLGGQVEGEYANLVQVLIAPERLIDLAADTRVSYVRPPSPMGPRAIAGEGVQASGASVWHAAGVIGTGVKVAVIDGGFRGLAERKAQGDIPASAVLVDLCNGGVDSTEHGTGVAEIIAEMAPGAQITMYCVSTEVQLGQAKDQAKAAGANIISMSLAFFNTSRGDGTGGPGSPDAIVADARNSGILWVNSAGNAAAGEAWNGAWNDPDNDGFLDWVNGDRANVFTLGNNGSACGYLRWDAWPTTAQDFSLEFRDPANFNSLLTPSNDNPQTGTQPPVEQLCYTNNTGAARDVAVAIRRVNATAPLPPRFDLNVFNQRLRYFSTESNIDIPASSPSAFAVGAVCWQSERLESYSSRGPTIDGRIKPDIAAQSVVSSGAYGAFQSCPAADDGQGGFNGTSAAAPHIAGAAALVKQQNPTFTPAQLQTFLEGRVRDFGAAGKDNQFGTGLLTLGTVTTPLPAGTPAVTISMVKSAPNRLTVTITAAAGQTMSSLAWTLPSNASALSLTGTSLPTGVTLPAGTTTTSFVLVRNSGTSVTLPITVNGSFSPWKTFVGGGPNAW